MENNSYGLGPSAPTAEAAQSSRFICPHCGVLLSPADNRQCPSCGIAFSDSGRKEQIEQLLKAPLSQTTYTVASSATTATPPSYTESPAEPDTSASPTGSLHTADIAPSKKMHKYRHWLIAVLAVLLLSCLCFSAAAVVNSTRLGYNASPEKLIMGFQKAIEDHDNKLLASLFVEEEGDNFKELTFTSAPPQLEIYDILQGDKEQIAFIYVMLNKPEPPEHYSNYPTDYNPNKYPYRNSEQFYAYKIDGKWYLENILIRWNLYTEQTSEYSY